MDNLWGMNSDGAFLHNVEGVKAVSFTGDGQYFYYASRDKHAIVRYDPYDFDTHEITILNDADVNYLNFAGGMLYFTRDEQLMKMNTDGTGLEPVGGARGAYLNVIGDWIYYANADDGGKLYRIMTDGRYPEKLCDVQNVSNINIAGGWVYFLEYENRGGIADYSDAYKIRLDGSELMLAKP